MTEKDLPSTKPYMIRAIHEWCTDNGLTPHIAVRVDRSTQVSSDIIGTAEQRITDNQQLIAQRNMRGATAVIWQKDSWPAGEE